MKTLKIGEFGKCIYCGECGDNLDHLIPYSYFRHTKQGTKRKSINIKLLAYSCSECNHLASNKIFTTFQQRQDYVRNKLAKRYKKFMTVIWDKDELQEVKGNLRKYIEGSNNMNKIIRERLNYKYSPDFLKMYNEFVDKIKNDPTINENYKKFFYDIEAEYYKYDSEFIY